MPTYKYFARDDMGRIQRGALEANTPSSLRSALQARGLRLVRMQEEIEKLSVWQWAGRYLNPLHYRSPRNIDIELLFAQMAVMLRSGVTLLASLRACEKQSRYRPTQRMVRRISESVQDGTSLADAFEAEKHIPQIAVRMTYVGEMTGNLDTVLDSSAKTLASRRQIMSQTITALAYPLIVALVAIAVAAYMVIYVIPKVESVISSMGRKLPALPQMLMDISAWIQINGGKTTALIVGAILACVVLYLYPPTRLLFDRYALRIPVIGHVVRLTGTLTFSSSMRSLIGSGITVVEALRTVEKLHYNKHFANCVGNARDAVIEGNSLATSLSKDEAYLPMLGSMMAVAENTGQMEEVLDHVTDFHQQQLSMAIKRLSALLEPAIVIFVGGIVGFVYISFFIALFSATGAI